MSVKSKLWLVGVTSFMIGIILTVLIVRGVVREGLDDCEADLPRNKHCKAQLIFVPGE